MKMRIFEWTSSVERDVAEEQINELLAGSKVVNILQSSSPQHVSISVWYEEASKMIPEDELFNRGVEDVVWPCEGCWRGMKTRIYCTFVNANIQTVGQLVQKTPMEMLKYRNFGRKSLAIVERGLATLGLRLGMKFP